MMRWPKLHVLLGYIIGGIITAIGTVFMFFVSLTYQLICMVIMLSGMSILSVAQEYDSTS